MNDTAADKRAIEEIVNNWVIWSDSGDWDRFATVWHDDGWMTATWFQGPAKDFARARRAGFERGVSIIHFLGAVTCDVAGARAIAQSKMTINQRASIDGVLVDVVCMGRFYDFFAKRAGRWAIVRRQPIYEKDRLDPVDPSAELVLDPHIARPFPGGLSPSRLPANEGGVRREARPARRARTRSCEAVCGRQSVARRRPSARESRRGRCTRPIYVTKAER